MDKAFCGVEPHDAASGTPTLQTDHAAGQIEDDEHCQHAENGDGTDPPQRHLVKMSPIATFWLLDRVRLRVGNATASLDMLELLEELIFANRAGGRID